MAKKGFAHGGSAGGASIYDIHSGVVSKDTSFISIKEKKLHSTEEIKTFKYDWFEYIYQNL